MKKIIALLLSVVIAFSVLTVASFAVNAATLSVGNASGSAGDTVEIAIDISDNPGIVAMKFSVGYDSSKLELTSVADGGLLGTNTAIFGNDINVNPYTLIWEDGVASANHTDNGTIATLTFKILDTADAGDTNITVLIDEGSTFNLNIDEVAFSTVNGVVTIADNTPQEPTYSEATLALGNVSAASGETVEIPIVMYNNPGIVSLRLSVSYSSANLTLISVADGGLMGAGTAEFGNDLSENPYNLTWEDGLSTTNHSGNGTLVTLTFQVNSTAAVGDTAILLSYDAESTFDMNLNNVVFEMVDGTLTIEAPKPTVTLHSWNSESWNGETTETDYSVGDTFTIPENPQIVEEYGSSVPWVDTVNGGLYYAGDTYTVTGSTEFYLLGDVSGDGCIDAYDVVMISRFVNEIITADEIVGGQKNFIWQSANVRDYDADFDLTNDTDEEWVDYFDSSDVLLLKRFINGYDVTLA